ncbi:MAG: sigma-54 dependent transcriptional regulator, partial [bacterium]|nr:sigma-54 dependent transcriptional regulator [bacterium]
KSIKNTKKALELGVTDFIYKPFNRNELTSIIEKVLFKTGLPKEGQDTYIDFTKFDISSIITQNPAMLKVFREINHISKTDSSVLLLGESGTGKELAARCIHNNSIRREKPFVPIQCAAIPSELLESELFGYVRGAFTGAQADKPGKFEKANTGTIFLDEIGTLPLELQVKLLRVLQEHQFERIGSNKTIDVDIRIISATNIDLRELIKNRQFREDLYYRLNVVPIVIPPLRERKSDIPLLIRHFIKTFCKKAHVPEKNITKDILEIFMKYSWPGNVRELENTIERMTAFSSDNYLSVKDIPLDILTEMEEFFDDQGQDTAVFLKSAIKAFERSYILKFLEKYNWRLNIVSKHLGIHRNSLTAKIRKFNIKRLSD